MSADDMREQFEKEARLIHRNVSRPKEGMYVDNDTEWLWQFYQMGWQARSALERVPEQRLLEIAVKHFPTSKPAMHFYRPDCVAALRELAAEFQQSAETPAAPHEGPLCDECNKPSRAHYCYHTQSSRATFHPSESRQTPPAPEPRLGTCEMGGVPHAKDSHSNLYNWGYCRNWQPVAEAAQPAEQKENA